MLLSNNILQQALPNQTYNIIIIRNENDSWLQNIPRTQHKFFPIQSVQDLPQHINYNFILTNHIHFNTDRILHLSNTLHIPICIYENIPRPEQINKVTLKQLTKMIKNTLVVFENNDIAQNWETIVSDNVLMTEWNDVFDLMKRRIYHK